MDIFSIDILTLVPAECAVGQRLGFHYELVVSLASPFVFLIVLLLLAVLVAPLADRPCSWRSLSRWPQIWDLAVWLLLLMYPALSKKTLEIFDCMDAPEERRVMRADPATFCDNEWYIWAGVAGGGAIIFGLGLPLLFYLFVRRLSRAKPDEGDEVDGARAMARARLVQVLTKNYSSRCWYYESIELVRKFSLTGIISILAPQTRVQLWFGTMVCIAFLMLHMHLQPFRDPLCNLVQLATLVQLSFTYVSALLFYEDDVQAVRSEGELRDRLQLGWLMVIANCTALLIMAQASVRTMRRLVKEMREERLRWPDGSVVQLRPPQNTYHVFLSHVWRFGQDQAASIKNQLRFLVPSTTVFLDVDDLDDISKLEQHVSRRAADT